ncbi:MAG: hypothetical protein ACK5P0_00985 [bacterium]|jgi:hypothetical protein
MRSKRDKAIEVGINREMTIKTFHKNTKVQDDGCIIWTKKIESNGYARFGITYREKGIFNVPVYAHRFAWALRFGMDALPIGVANNTKGDRLVLNHMCHNRSCVNTNHLEAILQSENMSKEKRKPKDGAA